MKILRSSYFLAALSGAFAGLCWLPTGLAPLFFLAFLGMMLALRRAETPGEAIRLGLLNGAFRYAVASHFLLALVFYSPMAIVFYLLAILFILPMAVLESWGAFVLERRIHLPRSVGFALIWTLMEKVRTMGDLSFPADLAAHAFGTAPAFLSWAPVIGPFGVTLSLMTTALLLERAWVAWPARLPALAWTIPALVVWLGPLLTGSLAIPSTPSPVASTFRVGIVQPSISQEDQRNRDRRPVIMEKLRRLSLEAARRSDLILWPETVRPGYVALYADGGLKDPEIADIAMAAGVPILYGAVLAEIEDEDRIVALYNGAILMGADGKVSDWYGKQQLLPFVEGLPYAKFLGLDPRQRARSGPRRGYLGMLGNFSSGPGPTLFQVKQARIGVLICYESFYPRLVRAYSLKGANVLAVLTNDIWWGHSAFTAWHARMASSRAREGGLPVVRAANSGISSLTDAQGRLVARTGFNEVRTLEVELTPRNGTPTFYAHYGDWILWLALILPLLSWAWSTRTKKENSHALADLLPD